MASVAFEEVLDEGLCFGWSESKRITYDEKFYYDASRHSKCRERLQNVIWNMSSSLLKRRWWRHTDLKRSEWVNNKVEQIPSRTLSHSPLLPVRADLNSTDLVCPHQVIFLQRRDCLSWSQSAPVWIYPIPAWTTLSSSPRWWYWIHKNWNKVNFSFQVTGDPWLFTMADRSGRYYLPGRFFPVELG